MTKKIIKYSVTILSALFFLLSIFIIIMGTIARRQNKLINIFGYSYSVVATNSMEPTIKVGEIIISKNADYDDVEEKDIIVFYSSDLNKYIVHRVIGKDEKGELITKGDNPLASVDEDTVNENNFAGVVVTYGKFLNIGNVVLKYRGLIFLGIIGLILYIIISEVIVIIKAINEEKEKELQLRKEEAIVAEKEKLKQQILEEMKNKENK